MAIPREQQVDLSLTPYYHCYARCVRQAYLFRTNEHTGKTQNHRKQWIVSRLKLLADAFAIDIAAYAIMSNHYHLVLHVDSERASTWDNKEVMRRWALVCSNRDDIPTQEHIDIRRQRLSSLSWFMRFLNEHIAYRANQEDDCKGHFWDSRFKSQALLDDGALLACMAYVNLNPIRAGITETPAQSDFTAIQERIAAYHAHQTQHPPSPVAATNNTITPSRTPHLMTFQNQQPPSENHSTLPFIAQDYFQLLEWTGRTLRHPNKGYIPEHAPTILQRAKLNHTAWAHNISHFDANFKRIVAPLQRFKDLAQQHKLKWMQGHRQATKLYLAS